jgi:hypothetical protein
MQQLKKSNIKKIFTKTIEPNPTAKVLRNKMQKSEIHPSSIIKNKMFKAKMKVNKIENIEQTQFKKK